MARLKQSIINKIVDALNNSRFSFPDFIVEFPDRSNTLAIITFRHCEDYSYKITEEKVTNYTEINRNFSHFTRQSEKQAHTYTGIFVTECPGGYKTIEKTEESDIDSAIYKISNWCNHIHEDLCTAPETINSFENIRENIEKIISENIKNENESFSSEEIEKINTKLDELYSKFEDLQEKNIVAENELTKLRSEINSAKNNAKIYPKGIWARITNNKLLQTIENFTKSKEGRELILEGIKKFFLE